MPLSEKETVALDKEELKILDAIQAVAPKHRIPPKLAQTYGVWTVCFRRYCHEQDVPFLWMSSVSDFMDFLDAHPNVSPPERNRALDGIMFYITDVHKTRQEGKEADEVSESDIPSSTQSLFARMLLRCDVRLTEALHLRREDVQLDDATLALSGHEAQDSRTVSLPSTLHEGLKRHLQRVDDRSSGSNPLLFRNREKEEGSETDEEASEEEIERSTELATQVMQTFENGPERDESSDEL